MRQRAPVSSKQPAHGAGVLVADVVMHAHRRNRREGVDDERDWRIG